MRQKRPVKHGSGPKLKTKPKLLALSFFTGAMGLDLGLAKAGIETVLASEVDEATCRTIIANRPNQALIGNIMDYSAEAIRAAAKLPAEKEIDLIFGGPP